MESERADRTVKLVLMAARLHPFRDEPNGSYVIHRVSLSHGIYEHESDRAPCAIMSRNLGRGDVDPLLDWAELSFVGRAA